MLPNTLGGPKDGASTPFMRSLISDKEVFIVEEIKSARRWLRALGYEKEFDDVLLFELNEHSKKQNLDEMLLPIIQGRDAVLLSEAGLPCVADPGSDLVKLAHEFGIQIAPLVGASSIMLCLMASDMNGQNFAFTGYLPREQAERGRRLKHLETLALSQDQTQLFMDAPYRNEQVIETMLHDLRPTTRLCIAADITTDHEYIVTKTVAEWRAARPNFNKRPVIFALGK